MKTVTNYIVQWYHGYFGWLPNGLSGFEDVARYATQAEAEQRAKQRRSETRGTMRFRVYAIEEYRPCN